jgi:hypothetical protein
MGNPSGEGRDATECMTILLQCGQQPATERVFVTAIFRMVTIACTRMQRERELEQIGDCMQTAGREQASEPAAVANEAAATD